MKKHLDQLPFEVIFDKSAVDVAKDMLTKQGQEDPFFVMDLSDVVYKHKLWNSCLPRVTPFYATKCNDNPAVLTLLAGLGAGFDCASKTEIDSVVAIGVDGSRIIYANPCKLDADIKHSATVGVDLMTFDTECELHKVASTYPGARLIIRIVADDIFAKINFGKKYGCKIQDGSHLLQTAKNLGLKVVGVSFHVGCNCVDYTAYTRAILSCRYIFDLGISMGFEMTVLDLGGGFPGHLNCQEAFKELSSTINKALEIHFPKSTNPHVTIIAEPGRYFVASSITLYTKILLKKKIPLKDKESEHIMYYLDGGIFGSFSSLRIDNVGVKPNPLSNASSRPLLPSSMWGSTCHIKDVLVESCIFPHMNIGEWLYFENMGAYSIVGYSNFCGFHMPPLKFIISLQTITASSVAVTIHSGLA